MSEFFKFLTESASEILVGCNFSFSNELKAECPFSDTAVLFACLLKATAWYLVHKVLWEGRIEK